MIRRLVVLFALLPAMAAAQAARPSADSVMIRLVNSDLRVATQLMSQYLDRPVVFSGQSGVMVTLETPHPIPRAHVVDLLRGLLESQNYELVADTVGRLYRARVREPVRTAPAVAPIAEQRSQSAPGAMELFVLPLKHLRAADIAGTLNALYGRGSMALTDSRNRVPTLSDDLRANQVAPISAVPMNGNGTRFGTPAGELMIVPDAHANTLLIRASRADFELIRDIVRELDVRPLQVLIEVMIAEVRRDRSLSLNVDGALADTRIGQGPITLNGKLGSQGVGDFALRVMGIGGLNLDATLRIAAERGDAKILSRPVIITANNQQAEIVVGSQRPFVQVSRSLPTDAATRDQIVQYKDVGTKLTVRPTISSDGLVQLDVAQEVSNATSETQFNAPVISTRSVQTQLLIQDGQTVVLGGLMDHEREVSQGGVPFLSAIPLLGGLFGHASRRTTETELFIFLTPRVIRTDDDAARLTSPFRVKAEGAKP